MTVLFPKKEDTLTSRNITDAYISAHQAIYGQTPECEYLEGRWFLVEGTKRDRHWLILEIERMRQEALSSALDNSQETPKGRIFKMIRRLSRI